MGDSDSSPSTLIGSLKRTLSNALRKVTPSGSIAQRTAKSGVWVSVMNVSDRGLQLVVLIVLARLLSPRAFGLFGIALVALNATQNFTEIGLNAALIQQKTDNVDDYLNTVWVLEAARGAIVAAVAFLAAPLVASFFGEPHATDLLRVIALSPLLLGLRNPGIVYFQKGLEFHKQFAYQVSGSLLRLLVAVGYALVYANVWALVIGYIAADVTRLAASYAIHDYRPRFEFNLSHAKELIGYGKWITGSSILIFLYSEGDDVIVGWLLSASALAFYQLAYRIANAPATEIANSISSVTFPLFSKLQDDTEGLKEAFFKSMQITMFVAFPVTFGIAAVAPTFVEAFLGEKWLPIVTTMQLLVIWGLTRAIGETCGSIWKAVGRPDYLTKLPVIRVGLLAIFIYPVTTRFGIEGTALLIVAISVLVMLPINVYITVDMVDTTYRRFARELGFPFAASAAMGLAVVLVRENAGVRSPIVEFVLLVAVGIVAYVIATAVLELLFGWGVLKNVRFIRSAL